MFCVYVWEIDIGNIFTISKIWLTPYSLQVHLVSSNPMASSDTRTSVTSWLNNKGLPSHICIVRYPTHLLEQRSETNSFDTMSFDRRFHSDRRDSILSSTSFMRPPLKYLYMERTFTPHPKILLCIRLLQTWEVRPKDLWALTPYSSYKERAYIHGILVSSIPLYKHQTPSSSRYVEFPNS